MEIKPLLKWVGGKTQIIDKIIESFPKQIDNYHETFVGGGSVLCSLLQSNIHVKGNIYAYDLNDQLIGFYKNVQSDPKKIYKTIIPYINYYKNLDLNQKEEYYYLIRNKYNSLKNKSSYLASSLFLFLNKTCFRGLFRESKKGFNVPYGHYTQPEIVSYDHLLQFSKLIKNVIFVNLGFRDSLDIKKFKVNDFVYLDPPYYPESKISFVGYTDDGFNQKDHEDLFNLCHTMTHKFVMSNSYPMKKFFKDEKYNIKIIKAKRAIDPKNPNRITKEVIIKNF